MGEGTRCEASLIWRRAGGLRVKAGVGVQAAEGTLFVSWGGEGGGYECCADNCDAEQNRGNEIEQRGGAVVEDVGESTVDLPDDEPGEADDDSNAAEGEERCADHNQELMFHRSDPGEVRLAEQIASTPLVRLRIMALFSEEGK